MTLHEKWHQPRPVPLTIEDFMLLDAADAFRAYSKTELIGGQVVAMNSQYSVHAQVKSRLFRRLADAVEAAMPNHEALVEVAVSIPPTDMPEPDIVVTNFKVGGERTPVPVDTVALVVEVADTTVRYDRSVKARLYATALIPEYWVVDIPAGLVHLLSAPSGEAYASHHQRRLGERLEAASLPLAIDLPSAD